MYLEMDAGRARVHEAHRAGGRQHRVKVPQVVLPRRTQRTRPRLEAGCVSREALVQHKVVLHATRQHDSRRARVAPARGSRGRAGRLGRDSGLPKREAHLFAAQRGVHLCRLARAAVLNGDRGRGGVAGALPPDCQWREAVDHRPQLDTVAPCHVDGGRGHAGVATARPIEPRLQYRAAAHNHGGLRPQCGCEGYCIVSVSAARACGYHDDLAHAIRHSNAGPIL